MSGIPDGSGGYQTVGITHSTDAFNALTGITTKVGTGSPSTDDIGASADGSITSDAGYFYQYDMFGRLVQVNRRDGGNVGPWVKHYTYDALGRLIRTQTPYPVTLAESLSYTEHYYYDGDRRIQEVATGVQLNEDGKPVYVKDELSIQTVISRDYVWDPDGGDSLIAQFDAANDLWFVISSLSGDAAALMSESGSVVAQYAFDSYGNVLDTDTLAPHSPLWIGHKGLFFDRLDQPLSPNRLAAGAEGHYHNRARTYAPKLGRFMQADPNASGLPVTGELAWMGAPTGHGLQRPDPTALRDTGAALHQYVTQNPLSLSDPTGLIPGLIPGLITGSDLAMSALDVMDQAFQGLMLGLQVAAMADEYNAAIDMAHDWAFDWQAPDDAYARSASWSMGTGFWSEDDEEDDPVDSSLDDGIPNHFLMSRGYRGPHDHHGFPVEFERRFKRIGIKNIHASQYRATLKAKYHLNVVHGKNVGRKGGAYNGLWQDFFDQKIPGVGKRMKANKSNAMKMLDTLRKNKWRIPSKYRRS